MFGKRYLDAPAQRFGEFHKGVQSEVGILTGFDLGNELLGNMHFFGKIRLPHTTSLPDLGNALSQRDPGSFELILLFKFLVLEFFPQILLEIF